jgi:hypothetical protein
MEILSLPNDKPWGQKAFATRTIDEHRITLGEVIRYGGIKEAPQYFLKIKAKKCKNA